MSRREQIRMSHEEVRAFLDEERTVTCATAGPRGWPHVVALWYVLRQESEAAGATRLWAWTYATSQKARNLERDPRATLLVEAGESYEQLRGVMLECNVVMHRDTNAVHALGLEIFRRYAVPRGQPEPSELDPAVAEMVARQAAKRVGLEFVECRRATWDHRKLAGVY